MSSMEELYNLDSHQATNQWGIDKKIPVALIFVVIVQTVGLTWGAATLSNNVKTTVERVAVIENDFKELANKYVTQEVYEYSDVSLHREIDDIKNDIQNLQNRLLHVERGLNK